MGSRVVLTCGVFDLFHVGHAEFLNRCASFGDKLVVSIMTDRWTEEFKKRRPVYDQAARARIVSLFKGVDLVQYMDTIDPTESMRSCGCKIFVHGNDWLMPGEDLNQRIPETAKKYMIDHDVDVFIVPYTKGVSTSKVRMHVEGVRS